ncbi:MAG: ComF family protein [Erythrobacter sp.]
MLCMAWENTIAQGLRPVVDLIYPPRCPSCGVAVATQGGLCLECWSMLEAPGEPQCALCQCPMPDDAASARLRCFECKETEPRHSGILAATYYTDISRKLVLSFKHGGKLALAPLLARMIAARLPPPVETMPLLVPVPLHRWRLWQRGFNQAALLAKELARLGRGEVAVDALVRRKRTPSLGGLGREARERVLAGAIEVRSSARARVVGADVILVDDVLTSGATSDACVAALLDAGARSVRIACFARVV